MAAVKIESHSALLEDGDEALLPEPKVEDGEEFVELDKAEEKKEEAAPAAKPAAKAAPAKKEDAAGGDDDGDLPADLKGKSPKELARMYREAQSLIGRQGSELGEFRRKADMLIQASLANLAAGKKAAEPAVDAGKKADDGEIDDSEFFANPKEAIAKAIARHPLVKQIEATLGKAAATRETERAAQASERFHTAHPDAAEIMQDTEFRKWVGASRVRTALLQRAHSKFDFDAGDEIFGTWKALRGVKASAEAKAESKGETEAGAGDSDVTAAAKTLAAARRKAVLRDAATPTGGGGGGGKEAGSKKIYRRADVLRLMEEDSARYEALAPEIELAYREGRVR